MLKIFNKKIILFENVSTIFYSKNYDLIKYIQNIQYYLKYLIKKKEIYKYL
jgi:hypothetical protein